MTIIEFVEDPRLVGDKSLSPAQRMGLKAAAGQGASGGAQEAQGEIVPRDVQSESREASLKGQN